MSGTAERNEAFASPGAAPRFGLAFQSDKCIADYERLSAAAESFGFDVLSVFGDLWFQPPIVALQAMARATARIVLGPACLNPFVNHPVEIAAQIAALDAASGGRAYLGLARGAWLAEIGIDQQGAVEALGEALAVVEALLAGDDRGVPGRRFFLPAGARLHDGLARRRVPLLIGSWGRRLAGLAGGLADEVKLGGSANPAMVALLRGWIDAGGEARGRHVGLVVGAVTVVDEDRAAARRRARREVAMYLDVVGALDATVEIPDELLETIRTCVAAGDTERAATVIPDELLTRFAFCGTPEDVAAQAAAVIEAGAERVEFGTPHGLTEDIGVALLGCRVLPALRHI